MGEAATTLSITNDTRPDEDDNGYEEATTMHSTWTDDDCQPFLLKLLTLWWLLLALVLRHDPCRSFALCRVVVQHCWCHSTTAIPTMATVPCCGTAHFAHSSFLAGPAVAHSISRHRFVVRPRAFWANCCVQP